MICGVRSPDDLLSVGLPLQGVLDIRSKSGRVLMYMIITHKHTFKAEDILKHRPLSVSRSGGLDLAMTCFILGESHCMPRFIQRLPILPTYD